MESHIGLPRQTGRACTPFEFFASVLLGRLRLVEARQQFGRDVGLVVVRQRERLLEDSVSKEAIV